MSTVRMCDVCGNIFSEREDGWRSMMATTVRRKENGQQVTQQENLDACPRCTGAAGVPRPMLADGARDVGPAAE